MATNIEGNGQSDVHQRDDHDTRSSCRRRLLIFGKLFLHLGCLSYSLYLVWLLAYLKDNPYYWFLSIIPFFFNVCFPFLGLIMEMNRFKRLFEHYYEEIKFFRSDFRQTLFQSPCFGVVLNLMACFTMLTRIAYYHRQPDEFIGPRFIIMSLQASIVLIVLDSFLLREFNVERLLKFKDTLTRLLLDFVDIFNMIEILSLNECVGVGSYVTEESPTEKSIQAFCTMSFTIVTIAFDMDPEVMEGNSRHDDQEGDDANCDLLEHEDTIYSAILNSSLFQNIPFLVIRIVAWARYRVYNLGFLVKNVFAIILFVVSKVNAQKKSKPKQDQQLETETETVDQNIL